MSGTYRPEVEPGVDGDAAAVEKRRRRIVAEAQLATVQPGEEHGLLLLPPRGREMLGQQVGEQRAIVGEIGVQRIKPRAAVSQCGDVRDGPKMARPVADHLVHARQVVGRILSGDDQPRLDAGEIPGL